MRHFVAPEHQDYFNKHHWIELEGLVSPEKAQQLSSHVEQTLINRLRVRASAFSTLSSSNLFGAGRDLWRDSIEIRKTMIARDLLAIVATLTHQSQLRIGYDQYWPAGINLMQSHGTIESISCLQGIVGGIILALKTKNSSIEQVAQTPSFLPTQPGHLVVFSAQAELDFSQLLLGNGDYLLMVYTAPQAVYVYREADLNGSFLKEIGYHLSDKLKDKHHPIVYRR